MTEVPRVVVELRIAEFVDGHLTNECKLRQEGDTPYLDMARRCITAMGGETPGTDTSISDVMHKLTDLLEAAPDIDEIDRREMLGAIATARQVWPYNALVQRRNLVDVSND